MSEERKMATYHLGVMLEDSDYFTKDEDVKITRVFTKNGTPVECIVEKYDDTARERVRTRQVGIKGFGIVEREELL